jgi:hypothetical protein
MVALERGGSYERGTPVGFRVQDSIAPPSGFKVQGSEFRVQGSGFRVQGPRLRLGVQDSGFNRCTFRV